MTQSNVIFIIENFIKNANVKAVTINTRFNALMVFLTWASDSDRNYIPYQKYTKKYRTRNVGIIKDPYSVDEYKKIIKYLSIKSKDEEFSLFIQFLWETGSRCGEALNIKIKDIDHQNNYIKIQNKIFKGQQEVLLLTDSAIKVVSKLIELAKMKGNENLFSFNRKDYLKKKLIDTDKALGNKIEGRGFHGFRRAFCDRLFDSGLEITMVQEVMRHKDIQTTLSHYKSWNKVKTREKMNEKLILLEEKK